MTPIRALLLVSAILAAGSAGAAPVTPVDCALPGDARCEVWTATVNGDRYDAMHAGAASPSGDRFFVAGRTNSAADYFTVALDANGGVAWQQRLQGGAVPTAVVASPAGDTVVVAGQQSGAGGSAFALVAYATGDGTQRWVARYDTAGYDWALDVVSAPDGSAYYATGATQGPGGYNDVDYQTVAVDGATGALLWSSRSGGTNLGNDNPLAVAISPDGDTVAVTGWWSEGYTGNPPQIVSHFGTIAYDAATGDVVWRRLFTGPGTWGNIGYDLAFSPDSRLLHVTGNAQRPGAPEPLADYGTVTYEVATGDQVWTARYDACRQCWTTTLAVGPDGTVYVVGDSLVPNQTGSELNFATVAYDGATGARRWVHVYDAPFAQLVSNTAIAPGGATLYVSGVTQPSNHNHLTTVAIDTATGLTKWDARYGIGSVGATTFNPSKPVMGVAPGRLFVGATAGIPTLTDFFAAAYDE